MFVVPVAVKPEDAGAVVPVDFVPPLVELLDPEQKSSGASLYNNNISIDVSCQ